MPEEVAVQEAPAEVSQDKPADSPLETPPILPEDTGVEQVAEAGAEAIAEPEQAPEEPPETASDIIKGLPVEVLDQAYRERGHEIPSAQEDLRRKEQSARDSALAEETRRRAQQEDTQRVLLAGQQAITEIHAVIADANRAIEEGTGKVDEGRLTKAITDYNRAWLMGQADRLNTELQDGFLKVAPVVAALTEEDMGQLTEAVKTSNKQATRVPTIEAMFALTHQKGFQGGYAAAIQDLVENDKRQKATEGQRDGLRRLKESVPSKSPPSTGGSGQSRRATLQQKYREGTGTAAEDAEYRRILDGDEKR